MIERDILNAKNSVSEGEIILGSDSMENREVMASGETVVGIDWVEGVTGLN